MSKYVINLENINSNLVESIRQTLITFLETRFPEYEFRSGTIHDLLIWPASILLANVHKEIAALPEQFAILGNNNLMDDGIGTEILEYWLKGLGIEPEAGAPAIGSALLVFQSNKGTYISTSHQFTSNGITFTPIRNYSILPTGSIALTQDEVALELSQSGEYYTVIELTSIEYTEKANISRGTELTPVIPISGLIRAAAWTEFTGGVDSDTIKNVLERLKQGITAKTYGGPAHLSTLIRKTTAFPSVSFDRALGWRNQEMTRNKSSQFQIAQGGFVDWYVRTKNETIKQAIYKTAHFLRNTTEGSLWRVEIGRDDLPGFYNIASILDKNEIKETQSYPILSEVRGVDTTKTAQYPVIPHLPNPTEGIFTAYQTAEVQFLVPEIIDDQETTRIVKVILEGMPLIYEIQTWANDPQLQCYDDILIRAAVPCFTNISIRLNYKGTDTLDIDLIKREIANVINTTQWDGQLFASKLILTINQLYPETNVEIVDMSGILLMPYPNQENTGLDKIRLTSRSVLQVPYIPEKHVSKNTVIFLTTPEQVDIVFSDIL